MVLYNQDRLTLVFLQEDLSDYDWIGLKKWWIFNKKGTKMIELTARPEFFFQMIRNNLYSMSHTNENWLSELESIQINKITCKT